MKLNYKKIIMAVIAVGLLVGHVVAPDKALMIYSKGCEVIGCESDQ